MSPTVTEPLPRGQVCWRFPWDCQTALRQQQLGKEWKSRQASAKCTIPTPLLLPRPLMWNSHPNCFISRHSWAPQGAIGLLPGEAPQRSVFYRLGFWHMGLCLVCSVLKGTEEILECSRMPCFSPGSLQKGFIGKWQPSITLISWIKRLWNKTSHLGFVISHLLNVAVVLSCKFKFYFCSILLWLIYIIYPGLTKVPDTW